MYWKKKNMDSINEMELQLHLLEGFDELLDDDLLDDKYMEQFMQLIRNDDEQIIESSPPATAYYNYHVSGDMGSGNAENGGGSSGTTNTTRNGTATTRRNCKKVDRSRTLVSERRRRGRMKDNLYALRSLVPNITKMDKASIIGDAVLYIQELQQKANNLQKEIACIESSSISQAPDDEELRESLNTSTSCPVEVFLKPYQIKKILQMDVIEVEKERGYYGKIVCKKGQGIAAYLYKAMESLEMCLLHVHSSNITSVDENYVLTLELNIVKNEIFEIGAIDMDLSTLKLWIASAFLSQGFNFDFLL